MENSSQNPSSQTFSIVKKGYNTNEVDEYINRKADELEQCQNRIFELEEELTDLRNQLSEYYDIDRSLRDKLLSLSDAENETIRKAEAKAAELINDAENESARIINNSEQIVKTTRDTLIFMKEQHEILLTRLKIIISNQDAMLHDFNKGNNIGELRKTMAEAAAFKLQTEMNIDSILEKLL